jgi:hypothetical protein
MFNKKNIHKVKTIIVLIALYVCFGASGAIAKRGIPRTEPTFKVTVSNTKPGLNEPVTVKAKYTADADMEDFIFYIHLKQSPSAAFPVGSEAKIDLLQGETYWQGRLKKGETIKKEITISFPSKTVYGITVRVRRTVTDRGFQKIFIFYPGGAFEENDQIRNLRIEIAGFKKILTDSLLSQNEKMLMISNKLSGWQIKSESRKIDGSIAPFEYKNKKHKEQNDSLYQELLKEYKELKKDIVEGYSKHRTIIKDIPCESDSAQKLVPYSEFDDN